MINRTWQIKLVDKEFRTHSYKVEADGREDAVKQVMNRAFAEMPTNKFGLVEIAEILTDGKETVIHYQR